LGKIAKARQNILNKISRILEKISKLILFEEQLTPQLIQDKTYSYKGSCGTSTFFRHKTFLLNIKSLFLRWQCASWWRNPVGSHQQKIIEKYKNISIENRWIGLLLYSIFWVTRIALPGYRNLFLPLFHLI
jgi:predicted glycosyltransferase